jgi:hypothetical protein
MVRRFGMYSARGLGFRLGFCDFRFHVFADDDSRIK